jgi:hypothetical protein
VLISCGFLCTFCFLQSGGAVVIDTTGTFQGCKFTTNSANGGNGGAVRIKGKGTFTYTTFTSNSATVSPMFLLLCSAWFKSSKRLENVVLK